MNKEKTTDIEESETETTPRFSKEEKVKALKAAVENGQLNRFTALRIRSEMGIFQSDFTRKRESDAKRKARRKAQKTARKKQRK